MSEKNRIEKVILFQNMTSGQFAAEIGIQNSTLSHILNNRNNPSLDVLKKILSRFPEISTDWLILGQGSMLRQEKQSKEPTLFDSFDETSSSSESLVAENVVKTTQPNAEVQKEMLKSDSNPVQERQKPPLSESRSTEINNSTPQQRNDSEISPQVRTLSTEFPVRTTSEPARKVTKVILYFTDNTFQEFESK